MTLLATVAVTLLALQPAYQNPARGPVSGVTNRMPPDRRLEPSGRRQARELLVLGLAGAASVRPLPINFFLQYRSTSKKSGGSDARRRIHRRTRAGADAVPRSLAGCPRCRYRDEGLRHVRQRPASIPPAEGSDAGKRHPDAGRSRSSPATSPAASWSRSGSAVDAREAACRPARDGASLSGLHAVQPLPLRMAAALPGGAGQGLRQQRPWRPRAISEGARQYAGAAAGRTVVLGRCRDRLRFRHRLCRTAPHEPVRQRHHRDLRPGTGRAWRPPNTPRRWAPA